MSSSGTSQKDDDDDDDDPSVCLCCFMLFSANQYRAAQARSTQTDQREHR